MARTASDQVIPGVGAISVNDPGTPMPAGWERVLVTNVARLESGHTPSRRHPEWWGGDVPWISIPDARKHHGRRIYETEENTNPDGLANSAARLLPEGTVCLSRTASVGYCTVMGKEMATSQDFVNWVCSDAIEPDYLMNAFLAEGKHLLKFGKGTTHTTIYFPEVMAFHVELPPLNEQKRIVAKIDALTEKSREAREALDAVPALLDQLRQSILAAAFRGDLTKKWRAEHPDVEPATVLLERIRRERRQKWEEAELAKFAAKGKVPPNDAWKQKYVEPQPVDTEGLPELPEGWCWASVEELAELGGGLTKNAAKRKQGILTPLLSVAGVHSRRIDVSQVSEIRVTDEDEDKGTLVRGDLLVVEGNGSVSQIGRAAIWNGELPNARHQNHLIRCRFVGIKSEFALEWLASPAGRLFVIAQATSATGLYNLSLGKVGRLPVPLPPHVEHLEIVERVLERHRIIRALEEEAATMASVPSTLDSSILAKAFRGELVPQDPNDEPARVLLERIRAERTGGGATKPGAGKKRVPKARS